MSQVDGGATSTSSRGHAPPLSSRLGPGCVCTARAAACNAHDDTQRARPCWSLTVPYACVHARTTPPRSLLVAPYSPSRPLAGLAKSRSEKRARSVVVPRGLSLEQYTYFILACPVGPISSGGVEMQATRGRFVDAGYPGTDQHQLNHECEEQPRLTLCTARRTMRADL